MLGGEKSFLTRNWSLHLRSNLLQLKPSLKKSLETWTTMLRRKSNVMHVMILSTWKLILRHTWKASTALLHQVQLLRFHHVKVLKFLLPKDLTHISPLNQNHLWYSLGHITGFVHIGAVTQGRLRRISSSSCDKSDAVSNSYVLLLEAINYYCCYCQKLSNRGEQPNSLSTKQPGRGCWPAGGARQNIPQR